jgi:hypothetical protein
MNISKINVLCVGFDKMDQVQIKSFTQFNVCFVENINGAKIQSGVFPVVVVVCEDENSWDDIAKTFEKSFVIIAAKLADHTMWNKLLNHSGLYDLIHCNPVESNSFIHSIGTAFVHFIRENPNSV